jgi:L-idonate 5-dehydrogenase
MKAIVIHQAKDLRIQDWPEETLGAGEIRIRTAVGGVCGSDLHYYHHGGFGTVRVREPMVLGHEVSGYVVECGEGVQGFEPGDLVAVSPSRPCKACRYCLEGLPNHCENMRFYGSAMPFPHSQGAFREELIATASQCVKANGLTAGEAAMAEPLSVVLHAARRAGELLGKRVLVTGSGPIGLLSIMAARRLGASEVVATDLSDFTLGMARGVGADAALNMRDDPEALAPYANGKGTFDVLFECTGAAPAFASGLAAMRPRGIAVQLGLGGAETPVPLNMIVAKEVDLRGSFRFHKEFPMAVANMQSGQIDVKPLITHETGLDAAEDAFRVASNRGAAIKAQVVFSEAPGKGVKA